MRNKKITIFLTLSLALPFSGFASQAISKSYLARVNQLLQKTYPLIVEARANQDKTARDQFNYRALTNDIEAVQKGIADFINQRQIDPNTVKPMQAHYSEVK